MWLSKITPSPRFQQNNFIAWIPTKHGNVPFSGFTEIATLTQAISNPTGAQPPSYQMWLDANFGIIFRHLEASERESV